MLCHTTPSAFRLRLHRDTGNRTMSLIEGPPYACRQWAGRRDPLRRTYLRELGESRLGTCSLNRLLLRGSGRGDLWCRLGLAMFTASIGGPARGSRSPHRTGRNVRTARGCRCYAGILRLPNPQLSTFST